LIAEVFQLADQPALSPRYNIAPSQSVAVVRQRPGMGIRELVMLQWGLIPHWADDPAIGNRMTNARAETVATKPSFRRPFRTKRCLVVADGFYEWQKTDGGKQPFFIRLANDRPFGMAGLWEHWDHDDRIIESCTIVTTEGNELMSPIHDRMPVIIPPEQFEQWLDPDLHDEKMLTPLLRPFNPQEMLAYPVSTLVNKAVNEFPACIQPTQTLFDP